MNPKPCTRTKKDLIEKVAQETGQSRSAVKRTIQVAFDQIVDELAQGNRLEFREFGVFDAKIRPGRIAQNPKTMQPVQVPPRRTVKFKPSQSMRDRLRLSGAEAHALADKPAVTEIKKAIEVLAPEPTDAMPVNTNGVDVQRENVIETSVDVRGITV